jgi:hypothetical protein
MLRLVVFLLFLAAVLYALFWLLDQRAGRAGRSGGLPRRGGGEPGGRSVPRGPVGPDDDDDFLRELDWRNRKRHEHDGDS